MNNEWLIIDNTFNNLIQTTWSREHYLENVKFTGKLDCLHNVSLTVTNNMMLTKYYDGYVLQFRAKDFIVEYVKDNWWWSSSSFEMENMDQILKYHKCLLDQVLENCKEHIAHGKIIIVFKDFNEITTTNQMNLLRELKSFCVRGGLAPNFIYMIPRDIEYYLSNKMDVMKEKYLNDNVINLFGHLLG